MYSGLLFPRSRYDEEKTHPDQILAMDLLQMLGQKWMFFLV